MRVMELMKQRCRLVLEWAAALTVPCNSFSLYFTEYYTFFSAAAFQKIADNRMRDLGWGIETAGAVTAEMEIVGERERKKKNLGPRRTPISLTTTASTFRAT